jgi:cytochrome bd ubiquinol oxidase subunit II
MLETLIAAVMLASLIVYALMGGADYGGGMWDLLASGPRAQRQRHAIVDAIAPIWEANHVWLILVIVLLFSGFPRAFFGDNDRVTYSHHRHVNRHRAARLGVCIS